MNELHKLLAVAALTSTVTFAGPALDQAEVRLPYGELKSLISSSSLPIPVPQPEPSLLSVRLSLSVIAGKPVFDAKFRTTTFADGIAKVLLVGGNITVESQQPPDARILISDGMLCQVVEKAGVQSLEMRLLPTSGDEATAVVIPACPASIFETGDLGKDFSIALDINGRKHVLGSNQQCAIPLSGGRLEIRMLGGEETREALRPPEPSTWTWQHQALVIPSDGEIVYQVLGRASASGGSGMSAFLGLPTDAREVKVVGEDLAAQKLVRSGDKSLGLTIDWKTRSLLDREVAISYRLPRRPLDRTWKLQAPSAPGENSTLTRFIVVGSPEISYAAEGLGGPFPPKGLPAIFADDLVGASCYQIEAATSADLAISPVPVVATAEATVSEAFWTSKLEPDGAMLVEGTMTLEHRGMLGVALEIPAGLVLLSCDVGGQPVAPVNLGDAKIEISLPAAAQKSRVSCSFTGRTTAIDPVNGTLELSLPKTPLFVRTLNWKIDLPPGYQAETSGNLVRLVETSDPPSRLTLRKNLCRDERPAANIFYQRANLKN